MWEKGWLDTRQGIFSLKHAALFQGLEQSEPLFHANCLVSTPTDSSTIANALYNNHYHYVVLGILQLEEQNDVGSYTQSGWPANTYRIIHWGMNTKCSLAVSSNSSICSPLWITLRRFSTTIPFTYGYIIKSDQCTYGSVTHCPPLILEDISLINLTGRDHLAHLKGETTAATMQKWSFWAGPRWSYGYESLKLVIFSNPIPNK